MARGRKKGVRITNGALEKARKKIKSTPKRGRWPTFSSIADVDDYVFMYKNLEKTFPHPKYGNLCFAKSLQRGEGKVINNDFGVVLPDEYKVAGAVRFYCESYNKSECWILDTCCMNVGIYSHEKIGCQRISCPYHKKGFIGETLKNKTFEKDIENIDNKAHNKKIDSKND